jgi:hypothetical protein
MACVTAESRVAARMAVCVDAYPLDRIHLKKKDLLPRLLEPLWPGLVQWSALTVSCVIQSVEGLCIGRQI